MFAGVRTLLVVSHVTHYAHENRLHAYGPYAREIDIWADLFENVVIAAPLRFEAPPGDSVPFGRPNIRVAPQLETGGPTPGAKAWQAISLPLQIWRLIRAMRGADAIHVRCPGNLGLLGVVLAPKFSERLVAKYAGQWSGFPGEAWSSRLQRYLLATRFSGPVTVYGTWPDQPPHIVPFFTSILSTDQIRQARAACARRVPGNRLEVLYAGRLSRDKNVHVLLDSVADLRARGVAVRLTIVGDGPERAALERQAFPRGPVESVRFAGALPFAEVLREYEAADVLVLASESEGWPKAITEGMAFGLVCVGSNRGVVPHLLGEGRGLVVPPGDAPALTAALSDLAARPEDRREMGRRASDWAQAYSLDGLRDALRELLLREWGIAA